VLGTARHLAGGDDPDTVRSLTLEAAKISGIKYVTDAYREEAYEIINS
jgi:hypothetical protein